MAGRVASGYLATAASWDRGEAGQQDFLRRARATTNAYDSESDHESESVPCGVRQGLFVDHEYESDFES